MEPDRSPWLPPPPLPLGGSAVCVWPCTPPVVVLVPPLSPPLWPRPPSRTTVDPHPSHTVPLADEKTAAGCCQKRQRGQTRLLSVAQGSFGTLPPHPEGVRPPLWDALCDLLALLGDSLAYLAAAEALATGLLLRGPRIPCRRRTCARWPLSVCSSRRASPWPSVALRPSSWTSVYKGVKRGYRSKGVNGL